MLSVSPKSRLLSWFLRASQAERAERSGLPVMLSVSETSHFSKRSPCGVPSLTLRMTIRTFFVAMTKKATIEFYNMNFGFGFLYEFMG
jgi:hypothetical protein